MSPSAIEKSINSAAFSLEMEGLHATAIHKELCRKLLAGELSMSEYIARVVPPKETTNGIQH